MFGDGIMAKKNVKQIDTRQSNVVCKGEQALKASRLPKLKSRRVGVLVGLHIGEIIPAGG